MNFVYIHCGSAKNSYSLMIRISIASVRISNPNSKITLLIDRKSFSKLKISKDLLLNEVDLVLVKYTPDGTNGYKSRYLKTRLGLLLDGPFVFLDSDTLVRKELKEVFENDFDIAGCRNLNRISVKDQINNRDLGILQDIGCSLTNMDYINSGVLFFSGSQKSKLFSEIWNKEWQNSFLVSKEIADQPSLYSTLSKIDLKFRLLPDEYNSQIKTRFWFETSDFDSKGYSRLEWDSSIWHFFASIEEKEIKTEFELAVQRLSSNNSIEQVNVQRLINKKHPWRTSNFIDKMIVDRVLRTSKITGGLKLWLCGDRIGALKEWTTSKF